MTSTSLYYFSLVKLQALIETYNKATPDGKTLQGFVFTPGSDDNGSPAVFAFPMFSSLGAGGSETILIQNTNITMRGCPYPPPCT